VGSGDKGAAALHETNPHSDASLNSIIYDTEYIIYPNLKKVKKRGFCCFLSYGYYQGWL